MIHLFQENGEGNLLKFLAAHRDKVILLAAPKFVTQLDSAKQDLNNPQAGYPFDIMPITAETLQHLTSEAPHSQTSRTFAIADPDGESIRIRWMEKEYSHLRFIGLGRDLFPMQVARKSHAVFSDVTSEDMAKTATIAFATPRSGSSLLADVHSDMGLGNFREHLRPGVIETIQSDYNCDLETAFRNYIIFSSMDGNFGTKVITHFMQDYISQGGNLNVIAKVCAGMSVKVIDLDRSNKVAQTISGFLAASRGIWHAIGKEDKNKIKAKPKSILNFRKALTRYFNYQQQACILQTYSTLFTDPIELKI